MRINSEAKRRDSEGVFSLMLKKNFKKMAEGGNIGEEKKRKKEESRRGKRQADVAEDINGKTGKVGGKGWGAEEG